MKTKCMTYVQNYNKTSKQMIHYLRNYNSLHLGRPTSKGTRWEEEADALYSTREVDEDENEASIWMKMWDYINKP